MGNFFGAIFTVLFNYPHGLAFGEMFKIGHFDRPRLEGAAEPRVMGNFCAAKVYAVMQVEPARADQVCTYGHAARACSILTGSNETSDMSFGS